MELGGDLLWMSSDIYLDRSEGSWGNSRGTLFRESPKGGLLGPLNARRVELGDLYTVPTMDLVGALPQGRGLNISNYPVNDSVRFATKTFRGPLPVGWSVEFFQNGSLVGYQPPTGTGVYLFQDVPLRFGINLFQLVFHGPLGEVREEKYRLDISQDQPAPGAFYYGVAGVQPESGLRSMPSSPMERLTVPWSNPATWSMRIMGSAPPFPCRAAPPAWSR